MNNCDPDQAPNVAQFDPLNREPYLVILESQRKLLRIRCDTLERALQRVLRAARDGTIYPEDPVIRDIKKLLEDLNK